LYKCNPIGVFFILQKMYNYRIPDTFLLKDPKPIHLSKNSQVFKGTFESKSAVLKIYPNDFPSEIITRCYHRDFQISSILFEKHPSFFSEPIKLVDELKKLYIIKSDFGISLPQHIGEKKKMETEQFLKFSIQICQVLQFVHELNIIHCDIKMENILYHEKTDSYSIIDFESSALVSLKNPKVPHSESERGTFYYMSPEQTGRTAALVDKTSDIYSLGITFFQLLTGKLPFTGDLNNVIYSHIAKLPPSIKELNNEIPDAIEEIVQKMLKKNQFERYCSLVGVKKELEFILKNLKNENELKSFKAGQFEVNDIFDFGDKLYGRDKEVSICKETLKKVQNKQNSEMIMICGASGIGKSVNFDFFQFLKASCG
jgi:serine/threonine protein kinase